MFDSKYDAYKLAGIEEVPNFFTRAGSTELSINTFGTIDENTVIPVHIRTNAKGIYSVNANAIQFSDSYLNAYLEDLKEGTFVKVTDEMDYVFSINADDSEHRFNLVFKDSRLDEPQLVSSVRIFSYDNVVHVSKEGEASMDVFVYDILGRVVTNELRTYENELNISVPGQAGTYVVKVISNDFQETKKVFIR